MNRYEVNVTREGKWWMVSIPALGGNTQAHRLSEAEQMAREFIASTLDISLKDVAVSVEVDAVGDVKGITEALAKIREERAQAGTLEREATAAVAALAKRLAAQDVPLRDVGTVLGVSHQRAHQLVNS